MLQGGPISLYVNECVLGSICRHYTHIVLAVYTAYLKGQKKVGSEIIIM